MKKFTILAVALIAIAACNKKTESTDVMVEKDSASATMMAPETDMANPDEMAYACPMHPEMTGKKGDKCPTCEMDMTPVK